MSKILVRVIILLFLPLLPLNALSSTLIDNTTLVSEYDEETDIVLILNIETLSATSVKVTWKPPKSIVSIARKYIVQYEHTNYRGCGIQPTSPVLQNRSVNNTAYNGLRDVSNNITSIILTDLIPYSRYLVTVAVETVPLSSIEAAAFCTTTEETGSDVSPYPATPEFEVVSPTSLEFYWLPPECYLLTAPLNYKWELIGHQPWTSNATGYTKTNSLHLSDLIPFSLYTLRVWLSDSFGNVSWNTSLMIEAMTPPAAPPQVNEFSVYQKTSTSIFIRWKSPYPPYGELGLFLIYYSHHELNSTAIKLPIPESNCTNMTEEDFNCYEIKDLKPNTLYGIQVGVQNTLEDKSLSTTTISDTISVTTFQSRPPAPPIPHVTYNDANSVVLITPVDDASVVAYLVTSEITESSLLQDPLTTKTQSQVFPVSSPITRTDGNMNVTNLSPASTYRMWMSAVSTGGESDSILIPEFSTDPEKPVVHGEFKILYSDASTASFFIPNITGEPKLTTWFVGFRDHQHDHGRHLEFSSELPDELESVLGNWTKEDAFVSVQLNEDKLRQPIVLVLGNKTDNLTSPETKYFIPIQLQPDVRHHFALVSSTDYKGKKSFSLEEIPNVYFTDASTSQKEDNYDQFVIGITTAVCIVLFLIVLAIMIPFIKRYRHHSVPYEKTEEHVEKERIDEIAEV